MEKIVFFDFDGTLIKSDSFITFSRFAVGNVKFALGVLKALPWIVCWKLGIKSGGWAKEHLFGSLFSGMSYDEWQSRCMDFISRIDKDLREDVVKRMRKHQACGHKIVIVTASPVDWVRPWAESVRIDDLIGTEVEIDSSSRLTGRFKTPNCHGREKVIRVLETFPQVRACETWAYGDSVSDKYLLSIVSHSLMVRKDGTIVELEL